MLQRLNNFAPYVVMAVLGYLTYSSIWEEKAFKSDEKESSKSAEGLMSPRLVSATARASPADRDPFEVDWASYRDARPSGAAREPTSAPAGHAAATAPASQPASAPAAPDPEPPPIPGHFTGAIVNADLRLAIIGDRLYKVGMTVGGDDPKECWLVEAIDQHSVTVRFGKTVRTLLMPAEASSQPSAARKKETR